MAENAKTTEKMSLKHVDLLVYTLSSLPCEGLRMKSSKLLSTIAHAVISVISYHILADTDPIGANLFHIY
jgi:hypothetical protein